jgi:hypothetical protein
MDFLWGLVLPEQVQVLRENCSVLLSEQLAMLAALFMYLHP